MRNKSLITLAIVTIVGIALALFLSGSASARALFGSEDVRDNSLKSVDIKDGEVKFNDLDPALQKTLVRLIVEYVESHPGEINFPPANP